MVVVKTFSKVCCDGIQQLICNALKNYKVLYKSKVLIFPSWKQVLKVTPCLISIFCFSLSLLQEAAPKNIGKRAENAELREPMASKKGKEQRSKDMKEPTPHKATEIYLASLGCFCTLKAHLPPYFILTTADWVYPSRIDILLHLNNKQRPSEDKWLVWSLWKFNVEPELE